MHRPIKVFFIWYGRFTNRQKAAFRTITGSLSPSSDAAVTVPLWWNINRLYYDSSGNFISGDVSVAGETDDTGYSKGKSLTNDEVDAIVAGAIQSKQLAYSADGVYFVMSDTYVTQSYNQYSFCDSFCGWHSYVSVGGYGRAVSSWVGNAGTKCPGACIAGSLKSNVVSPNGDRGLDGQLSVYMHELAEATSSPYLQTWYDDKGEENADKCSWKYGDVFRDSSGAYYNLVGKDGSNFLIQQNWNLNSGKCVTTVDYSALGTLPAPPTNPPFSTLGQFLIAIIKALLGLKKQGTGGSASPSPPPPSR
eukprot:TRINITY_DN12901_c0_g1_i3.p1 TRINITY_DN12901_c0_g1~~TRINITY_DN12901_c0_g1_i3.p1  ORF type:complete len:306 (-),score=19.55 TRINITY_DN12901_c0_g1_i3:104-1021(-)